MPSSGKPFLTSHLAQMPGDDINFILALAHQACDHPHTHTPTHRCLPLQLLPEESTLQQASKLSTDDALMVEFQAAAHRRLQGEICPELGASLFTVC